MNGEIANMRNSLNQKKGKRAFLIEQKEEAITDKQRFEELHTHCLQARSIVQTVAENTQKHIEYHISNLVSMALASVFPDPYKFDLRFVQRRNKTEADLIFSKNGNETDDILNTGGGGVADVASFALRIAQWSIKKTRPVLLLDETFKFLHNPVYQEKASEMLKEISDKLGIQIILVSDQDSLINAADKTIKLKNNKGISEVVI